MRPTSLQLTLTSVDPSPRVSVDPEIDAALIAIAAGTGAVREAARSQAEELFDLVDWSALARRLRERRLLPALGERLLALAGARSPDSFAEATQSAISECYEQDTWLELISVHLTDVLREAGIPSLV